MSVGKKAIIFGIVILIAILFSIPINAETQPEDQNWAETLQEQLDEIAPWPEGKKIPCMCDNLAMPYDLCLRGIGRDECFVKEVKEPENKTQEIPPGIILFNEALPCHNANAFIMRMQNELGMQPFAQGTATVRNADSLEFMAPKMVMLVNMETGTYMMLGVWPNGLGCVLAGGKNFEPYIKGNKT